MKAFILNGEWRDIKGKLELSLYVASESGPVEIIINNSNPVFFIERNVVIPKMNIPYSRKQVNLKNFNNNQVDAIYFNTQRDLKTAAEFLRGKNIIPLEDDIDPLKRYLMERFINNEIDISGEYVEIDGLKSFTNPKITKSSYTPELKVLSFDIETGQDGSLYSIACYGKFKKEVVKAFIISQTVINKKNVLSFKDEKSLLLAFINWLNEYDPDIIIGWHVIGFDLMFLQKKCEDLSIDFSISRGKQLPTIRETNRGSFYAFIPGRVVFDGPFVLRSNYFSFDDFKLETVANEILGEGKIISPEENKVEEIENFFKNDKEKLIEYNIKDAELVYRIFEKTEIIDMLLFRAKISGLFVESLTSMTAAFDHFYLPAIHRKGYVVNSLQDVKPQGHSAGGYVFEPVPGIYENVFVLDFKSLYPSIILTFKIDPYSLLMNEVNPVYTPNNIKFSSTEYILPDIIEKLLSLRAKAKQDGNKNLSQAIKILMNSFYGVMGSYGCRFYNPLLPTAITGSARWILMRCKEYIENIGFKVVYGDTDSLFVKVNNGEIDNESLGNKICRDINIYLKKIIEQEFGLQSYLELEFEKFYKKFVTTSARNSDYGAKKRYAGFIVSNDEVKIDFVGMEAVRSDWTKLAKLFQEKLYLRVFNNDEIESWLRSFVDDVKSGLYDDKLIYTKRIRKDIDKYVKNVPPQIKAARLINLRRGKIRYVITKRGPVPIELNTMDIDYNHYIEKQLKPVANSILNLIGKDFDEIVNRPQLGLFD